MFNLFKKRTKNNIKKHSKLPLFIDNSIENIINYESQLKREEIKKKLLQIKIKQHKNILSDISNISDISDIFDMSDIKLTKLKTNDIITIIPIENNAFNYYYINKTKYIIPNNKYINDYFFKKNIKKHIIYYQLCIINNKLKIISGSKSFNLKPNKTYHIKIINHNLYNHRFSEYIFSDVNINTNYKTIKCKYVKKIYINDYIFNNMLNAEKNFKATNLDFNKIRKLKNIIRKHVLKKLI